MKPENKNFAWHFFQLMFAVFVLFFLTIGLGKASADLVVYMNDPKTQKSTAEWAIFAIGAPVATAIWCILWLWFKKAEKHCIELLRE
jgi:hypothetical protein